jgi:hypothetical protein
MAQDAKHELTDAKSEPPPRVVSFAEMMGTFVLLDHAGHCKAKAGDDEESQEFAAEVLRLNRSWKPGEIPLVPAGYRDGRAGRAAHALSLDGRARNVRNTPRPREPRRSPRSNPRRSPRKARAPDDPHPEPDLIAIPPERFWRDVGAWTGAV